MDETEDDNFDSFFADAPYLEFQCDTEDCPPPLFDLPPPPRPPWLEPDDTCLDSSEYESCQNIVIIDSQVQLETTFHNLIIIAVCSAVLVILLVFLVACIWRCRHFKLGNCHCGTKPGHQDTHPQNMELCDTGHVAPAQLGQGGSYNEVYDNPNYSHIMIGGQPFFILPSGELSDHVPVPSTADQLTPRKMTVSSAQTGHNNQHIYEPGSSTYRSTSDYDTDSSNFRHESDRDPSDTCPPIYEEIDKPRSTNSRTIGHVSPPDIVMTRFSSPEHQTMSPHWSPHRSGTSIRPGVTRPGHSGQGGQSSMYYYSDTLKRRPMTDQDFQGSDSGISSRSGQNTSSESTPRHLAQTLLTTNGSRRLNGVRSGARSQELLQYHHHHPPVHLAEPDRIETQIIVKNTNRREPIVKV